MAAAAASAASFGTEDHPGGNAAVAPPGRRPKRPRADVLEPGMSAAEERAVRIAVEVSMRDQGYEAVRVPECPVFTPTLEEFRDPMAYIKKIAPVGWRHGIAKVVPPKGWSPPCGVTKRMAARPLATRKQLVHELQEADEFEDGEEYTLPQYKAMADAFAASFPDLLPLAGAAAGPSPAEYWSRPHATRDLGAPSPSLRVASAVEDAFWRIVETGEREVEVEYANDQDVRVNGSGFPAPVEGDAGAGDPDRVPVDFSDPSFYRRTGWNLNVLPDAKGSLLKHMKGKVAGVNVPWLYVGMLFATFAWHTEDNYLYSINYMHYGTAKTWYGIPASDASAFESAAREHLYEQFRREPDHIHKLTTVLSPAKVARAGVKVFHTVQEPGEFIVTFPRGYHSGLSHGFNIAEACNFALPDWIPMGRAAVRHYETVARETCFSHDEIVLRAAQHPEALDADACRLLAADLRIIASQAREDRAAFLAVPGTSEAQIVALKEDYQRYNCAVCKRMCFASAVVCESRACRIAAEKARAEARAALAKERAELIAVGVDPAGIVEPDPQHRVVRPRFADRLCGCRSSFLRMVVWHDEASALRLAAALERRCAVLGAEARGGGLADVDPVVPSTVVRIRSGGSGSSSRPAGRDAAVAALSSIGTPPRSSSASSDSPMTALSSAPAAARPSEA